MKVISVNTALNKAKFFSLCFAAVALLLGGCTPVFVGGALAGAAYKDKIFPPDINFTQRNYAVADYLVGQTRSYLKPQDLIVIEPLTDLVQPNMVSGITMLIPEQIGSRISQLGYRVDLSKVASGNDSNYLKPAIRKGETPDFIVSGTYTRQRSDIDVNMRIIDRVEGRVIGSFQYTLPLNREMRDLATPRPKIVRLTEDQ